MNDTTLLKLEDQSQPQQERLFYLEFRLYFLGHSNRSDLQKRFGLKESSASRDIALYKKLAPENVIYDYGIKSYVPQSTFKPLYAYTATQVLTALTHGFGDDYAGPKYPEIASEAPSQASLPFIPVLAAVTRAIHNQHAITIEYVSEEHGNKEHCVIPHALIDSGTRWSVRAFDRTHGKFSDFVINRIVKINEEISAPESHEMKDSDDQWNRIEELTLLPHPALVHPEAVEQEYGMRDGSLKMTCRSALKNYLLEQWRVDVNTPPSSIASNYQLWLKR